MRKGKKKASKVMNLSLNTLSWDSWIMIIMICRLGAPLSSMLLPFFWFRTSQKDTST